MFILILHVLRNELVLRKIRKILSGAHKRDTSIGYTSSPNVSGYINNAHNIIYSETSEQRTH